MKKLILILTLVSMLPAAEVHSQAWAPEGAEWYYDYENFYYIGYIHVTMRGDTVIHDTACRILNRFSVIHNLELGTTSTYDHGNVFMYGDTDRVYWFENNKFYVLYDFSALPGDTLVIPQNSSLPGFGCDHEGKIVVTDTGTVIINGQPLKSISVEPLDDSHWAIRGPIVPTIGPMESYMLPEPQWCVMDMSEGGPLRCYSDPEFGLFDTGMAPACDYLVSVPEHEEVKVRLFPNPCLDALNISVDEKGSYTYKTYNSTGSEVLSGTLPHKENELDLAALSTGIYYIVIINEDHVFTRKVIKK